MGKKVKIWCEKCQKKTTHERFVTDGQETCVCLSCKTPPEKDRMLDPTYIDPRERYSLRADRAIEEERVRWGRPF